MEKEREDKPGLRTDHSEAVHSREKRRLKKTNGTNCWRVKITCFQHMIAALPAWATLSAASCVTPMHPVTSARVVAGPVWSGEREAKGYARPPDKSSGELFRPMARFCSPEPRCCSCPVVGSEVMRGNQGSCKGRGRSVSWQ